MKSNESSYLMPGLSLCEIQLEGVSVHEKLHQLIGLEFKSDLNDKIGTADSLITIKKLLKPIKNEFR